MKRETSKTLMYLFLLVVVAPVGMKAYDERWWIRDPERLCRMALEEVEHKDYREADVLWRRAAKLRPDWFVPYWGLSGYPYFREPAASIADRLVSGIPWRVMRQPLEDYLSHVKLREDERLQRRQREALRQLAKVAHHLLSEVQELYYIWERNPQASALYDEGFRLLKAQRWRGSASKFEQGLRLYPRYAAGYAALIRSYSGTGESPRGIFRLLGMPPVTVATVLERLLEDGEMLDQFSQCRPNGWKLTFQHFYYASQNGWQTGAPPSAAVTKEDGFRILAARHGTVWIQERKLLGNISQNHRIWRLKKGKWFPISLNDEVETFAVTDDGQLWATINKTNDPDFPLRCLSGSRLVPALNLHGWRWRMSLCSQVIARKSEVWATSHLGLLRRAKGRWFLYPWKGRTRESGFWPPPWMQVQPDTDADIYGPLPDPMGSNILCVDRTDRLWYGDRVFDGKRFVRPSKQLLDWRSRCIVDTACRIWGPDDGFWGQHQNKAYPQSPWDQWNGVKIDASRRVWFYTKKGPCIWDGRQLMLWNREGGITGEEIRDFALDGNTLWIGTDRGVSRTTIPD